MIPKRIVRRRKDGNRFFNIRFSSSSREIRFGSSLTYLAVKPSPSSILTVEYGLIHFVVADGDTPYSLMSEV